MVLHTPISSDQPFISSQEFIDELKNHTVSSFDLLYELYGNRIFNLAYRYTGNENDASDITQETFFQVYRTIDTFRGESAIYTWIFSIAQNACYRVIRQKRQTVFSDFEQLLLEALQEPSPSDIIEGDLTSLADQVKEGCLTGLIGCLSHDQRMAFILSVLLHFSIIDTAEIMGKTTGSVKVLVSRARANLKSFLCKNCSLYDRSNRCSCKNLVGFSLKQGWISKNKEPRSPKPVPEVDTIENEIAAFQRIIDYYADLQPSETPQQIVEVLRAAIKSGNWKIFQE